MQTRYFSIHPDQADDDSLSEAASIIREGGLVVFPTETVYGLGASARHPEAVKRLYELKGKPEDHPLTLHLADPEDIYDHVENLPSPAKLLMNRYWPGPLTLILPGREGGMIGLRVPSLESTREFLRRAGLPIVATSANAHGEDPAVDLEEVRRKFDGRVDAILEGGPTVLQQASTIVRVNEDGYEVLREGIITHEMVHQLLSGKIILFVCTGNSCRSPLAETLYRKHLALRLGTDEDNLRELGYQIASAGLLAGYGGQASEHAVEVAKEKGCDLSQHISRPLTAEMVARADRIYAMSTSHLSTMEQILPDLGDKAQLLLEQGIGDPIGGDLETYRHCADEIEGAILKLLE